MEENKIQKSQQIFIRFTLAVIVILTSLLSFILFLTVINAETKFVLKIYDLFSNHKWAIVLVSILILGGLILCIIFLSLQVELFFAKRIQKMYGALESDTVKGIDRLPIGVISYDEDEVVSWINSFFDDKIREAMIGKNLFEIFPVLKMDRDEHKQNGSAKQYFFNDIPFEHKVFDIFQDLDADMLYFFDKTYEQKLEKQLEDEQFVVGFIYLDSPDELQVLEDSGNLDVSSEIHRAITSWANTYNVFVRKYSSYRWMLVTNKIALDEMVADNMNVRDAIGKIANEHEINISISGGFAVYAESMAETVKEAVEAIELGQSRGGDQLVVKQANRKQVIFGGDTYQKRRTSRVMVRSTALSLHNEIVKHDTIYLTGHAFPDLDAIGAILGIYEIVTSLDKQVKLVLDTNRLADGVEMLFKKVWRSDEALQKLQANIIAPNKVKVQDWTEKDLLIIADVSTPALLESMELAKAPNIIIIDHHRKGAEVVQNAIFEYIDPFSSSASEMVAELIQYQPKAMQITMEVATFLLGGIILDTNKFTRNVSSRTFEAASYLRKKGALQDYVLQVLGTNINDFIRQSTFLENSQELLNEGRLLLINGETTRLEIAKTADFLLTFAEVKYSIVVGLLDNGQISISARSKGTTNVQLVMEYFGGGGHFNNAAAQLEGGTVSEIGEMIVSYLNEKEREKTDTIRINKSDLIKS